LNKSSGGHWWPVSVSVSVTSWKICLLLINGDHVARMDHTGAVVDILNMS
jgi:hypothetical protein